MNAIFCESSQLVKSLKPRHTLCRDARHKCKFNLAKSEKAGLGDGHSYSRLLLTLNGKVRISH